MNGQRTNGHPGNGENEAPWLTRPMGSLKRQVRILIIGAGMSGLNMVHVLQKYLPSVEYTVYEKNNEVGGTWLENRYPGCACDVPSHIYQFSWAPNPDWTKYYSSASEIQSYVKQTAKSQGLLRQVAFSHQVTRAEWISELGMWRLEIKGPDGRTFTDEGHFLFNGTGILNNWKWPSIPGLHNFQGRLLHSAAYDEDYDLAGKRICVIGAGSSGVQIVAALQGKAASVNVFIRSPIWVTPSFASQHAGPGGSNFEYSSEQKEKLKGDAETYKAYIRQLDKALSEMTVAFYSDAPEQATLKAAAIADMQERLKDLPELAKKLIPDFPFGCRRPTPGNGFLEAFSNPTTKAVTSEISQITASSITTSDGQEFPCDAIICATGFDVTLKPRFPIIGARGQDLATQWDTIPEGYMGLAAENMPNYFISLGPSSPVAHGSLVPVIERISQYVAQVVHRFVEDPSIKSVTPLKEAVYDFNTWRAGPLGQMVYSAECSSWFKNGKKDSPAFAVHPGSRAHYLKMIKSPRWEDFEIEYSNNRYAYLGNGKTKEEVDGIIETDHLDEPESLW